MGSRRRFLGTAALGLSAFGCGRTPAWISSAPPEDGCQELPPCATGAGSVAGRVIWAGPPPVAPPFRAEHIAPGQPLRIEEIANPLVPRVASAGGLVGVLVVLHEVAPTRQRPWNGRGVTAAVADDKGIRLEGAAGVIGAALPGSRLELRAEGDRYHMLRAEGAAWFTVALPDKSKVASRTLGGPGLVEVSDPGGSFWSRAYVVVTPQPEWAVTDAEGRFRIDGVPPGRYELTAYCPDWREAGRDRSPETGLAVRLRYRPVLQVRAEVEVPDGGRVEREVAVGG